MSRSRGWVLLSVACLLMVISLLLILDRTNGESQEDASGPGLQESAAGTSGGPQAGVRPGASIINIMDHGAVGDGVTNDQAAWDAALAATDTGGTILFPPGRSFALPNQVVIDKTIRVSGHGAIVVKPAASAQLRTWFAVSANDVVIEGVTFSDPRGLVTQNAVLAVTGTSGIEVIRNTFGVPQAAAVRLASARDSVVEGNIIDGVREGIAVSGPAKGTIVNDNEIRRWRNYAIHIVGTSAGAPSEVEITGNRVTDLSPGGYPRYPIHAAKGKSRLPLRDVKTIGNVVLGPDRSFTAHQGGTADQISMHSIDGLLVEGNVSRGGGDMGITVENCRDATVTGNVVTRSDVAGIAVFTDVVDARIVENTLVDNGQNRAGDRLTAGRAGIRLATSKLVGPVGVLVADNVTGDTQPTKTQQYGVSIRSTTDVVAGPNVDAGNAIRLYLDEADNRGLSVVQTRAPSSTG